jgi:hypothetical protein
MELCEPKKVKSFLTFKTRFIRLNNKPFEIVGSDTYGNHTLKNVETGEYVDATNSQILKQIDKDNSVCQQK